MIPGAPPPERLSLWSPARQGLAAAALAAALVTSAAGATYAGRSEVTIAALVHVVAAAWALSDTRAIATQVGAGVVMAWLSTVGAEGTAVGVGVVVVGVVATSELLAAAGRHRMVVERDPAPEIRRVGIAAVVAAATSGVSLAAGALAGPPALVATAVAALGCSVLAVALRVPRYGGEDRQPRPRRRP